MRYGKYDTFVPSNIKISFSEIKLNSITYTKLKKQLYGTCWIAKNFLPNNLMKGPEAIILNYWL